MRLCGKFSTIGRVEELVFGRDIGDADGPEIKESENGKILPGTAKHATCSVNDHYKNLKVQEPRNASENFLEDTIIFWKIL